jgi:hypothetical protein
MRICWFNDNRLGLVEVRDASAPHPNPLPASGEREGPAKREGEGQQTLVFGDFLGRTGA